MSKIVLYPQMGHDIITPVLCGKDVYKIYAFGPLPKGQGLTQTINMIKSIAHTGHTGVFEEEDEELEDLFDLPLVCMKEMNFKSKELYYMQFKYGFEDEQRQTITLYYYYNARITDKVWPITEGDKIDYIVYKDYELSSEDKSIFHKMNVTKPTTKVFSTEFKLLKEWDVPEEVITNQEFIDVFDCTKKRLLKMFHADYKFKEPEKEVVPELINSNATNASNSNEPIKTGDAEIDSILAEINGPKPFFKKKKKKEKKNKNKKNKK